MIPTIFHLTGFQEGYLAIMGRPRGGDWLDDEIAGLKQLGFHIVVSLLEREEIAELALLEEEKTCHAYGIEYLSFPIQDRNVPTSLKNMDEVATYLQNGLMTGKGVAIHCRAGIGRSALVAACIFVQAHYTPEQAFDSITKSRHVPVPDTEEQTQWVRTYYQDYIQRKKKRIAQML